MFIDPIDVIGWGAIAALSLTQLTIYLAARANRRRDTAARINVRVEQSVLIGVAHKVRRGQPYGFQVAWHAAIDKHFGNAT